MAEEPVARPEELRLLEAMLFASAEPLDAAALAKRMPDGVDVKAALELLQADYALRGVNLVRIGGKWAFRTASDLSWLMTRESTETRKLSRAAIEVLAIIAYHQPVTRAEIEEIRGVATSKGTLDVLLETGWIKPRGRRKVPGRPLTFGTTETFLSQFNLEALGDLPGLEELKGTGLLDPRLPSGFNIPSPSDDATLREDEEPLEAGELDYGLAPAVEVEHEGAAPVADVVDHTPDAEAEVSDEDGADTESAEVSEVGLEEELVLEETLVVVTDLSDDEDGEAADGIDEAEAFDSADESGDPDGTDASPAGDEEPGREDDEA